jgi:hypothetical protein
MNKINSWGIVGIKYWEKYNFHNVDSPNIEDDLYEGMYSPEIFSKGSFKFKAKYSFKELKKPRPYYIQLKNNLV